MKNYLKNLKKKKKGFTLIELIIVLAIIAIISAIAIPKFGSIQKGAKIKADIANAKNIENAVSAALTQDGDATFGSRNATTNDITFDATSTTVANTELKKYLQEVPVSQLNKTNHFIVHIDNDDSITIYVGIDTAVTTNDTKIYPDAQEPYNQ